MNTVHNLADEAARRWPDAPAVRDAEGCWSHEEVRRHSQRMAAWLAGQGVRSGDRVAVAAPSCRTVVALLYACSRVGAAFVPLAPGLKQYQVDGILADAEPAVVVTESMLADLSQARTFGEPSTASADDDAIALLIYTSGSTGPAPKAVVSLHRQVRFATTAIAARLGYIPDDVVFCRLPLSFDYGLYQVFLCAQAGSLLVLAAPRTDLRLVSELNACRTTVIPLVPSIATMLIALVKRSRLTAPVRLLTNTGEHLPARTIAQLRDCLPAASVTLMFGTTECKRISILEPDGDVDRPGSVGKPLDDTTLRVIGPGGEILAPGQTGEIVVAGPHVMAGYWRAPKLTGQVFRDGDDGLWLHTGDFGYLDQDGYLYFRGRRDALFKRQGVRTSTLEVEAAARDICGVVDAVAFPPTAVDDLGIVVSGSLPAHAVLRELSWRLCSEKVPSWCTVVEDLPHTVNGKVDHQQLVQMRARGDL